MLQPMESTYQGYISSTHDALLVFECVRRGMMPKVKRRLREEERKLIRSGQVFVFDEKESGIKRWTDGLVWSPSRILWNFLVYRQVDKKFGGRPGIASNLQDASPKSMEVGLAGSNINSQSELTSEYDPYALGVTVPTGLPLYTTSIKGASSAFTRPGTSAANPETSRNRSISSVSDSFANWVTNDAATGEEIRPGSLLTHRTIDEERTLVGSLKSSYPFAKGGLCKKTISIQVDGSTQHLISYYSVEDVRAGRLRTPSSLPEIATLTISPILLTNTSFRFPPTIHLGPDGIPRFRGEDGYKVETGSTLIESSGEGNSSGNESRYAFYRNDPISMRQSPSQNGMMPMSSSGLGGRLSMNGRLAPMSHQVGGSGMYRSSQRSPDHLSGKARKSYEPYPKRGSLKSISDESIVTLSPASTHSAPTGFSNRRLDGLPDQNHQMSNMAQNPHSFEQTANGDLGEVGHNQHGLNIVASGVTISAEDSLNPYKEEESRQRLMDELLAEQMNPQDTDVPWHSPHVQEQQLRQRVMGDGVSQDVRWTYPLDGKSMALNRNEDGPYGIAPISYNSPFHYAPPNEHWSNTSSIPQQSLAYGQQQSHRINHTQPGPRQLNQHPSTNSFQEEAARRQHYQQMESDPYPPSFVVSAPNDGVRAALLHSSSYNRPNQPAHHSTYNNTHAITTRPVAVNKVREDALNLS